MNYGERGVRNSEAKGRNKKDCGCNMGFVCRSEHGT